MKFLFLLLPVFCLGQTTPSDSLNKWLKKLDGWGTINPGDDLRNLNLITTVPSKQDGRLIPETDTVAILMLLTDTGFHERYNKERMTLSVYRSREAYWQYGYEVLEKVTDPDTGCCGGYVTSWDHVEYLDEDKKKLNSSVIVWDVHDLKN